VVVLVVVVVRYPRGHYVSTLGSSGDKAVETAVLLLEHDIPTSDFTGDVLACLPPEGYEITEAEIAAQVALGRRDLRALPVMSIDPPGDYFRLN
jgi:exosome complex exonuclease DIS3/RRP44